MPTNKHILFGVLNWGLGHATRSIPVIEQLHSLGYKTTIASDGIALEYLQKRFPNSAFLPLQPLEINYVEKGSLVFSLLKKISYFNIWRQAEKKIIVDFLANNSIDGIVSDNRPTVFSPHVPSAYITHQWRIKAGIFSGIATAAHQKMANNFTQIWIPDVKSTPNISGKLGRKKNDERVKHMGFLSELQSVEHHVVFDVALILSGPEPQRTLFENELIKQLKSTSLKVVLVRGTNKPLPKNLPDHWKILPLAQRQEIAEIYAQSRCIVARCGYSTLMDLYTQPKPAVLIPTPGQPEQMYLAKLAVHKKNFAVQTQDNVQLAMGMKEAQAKFTSFTEIKNTPNWGDLFTLFST